MKRIIVAGLLSLAVFFGTSVSVIAQEENIKSTKVEKKSMKKAPKIQLVLTGRISKKEMKGKKDKAVVSYILTDTKGNKINLPTPKASKKEKKDTDPESIINLDDYLDVDVKVIGKGRKHKEKGKKIIKVKKIISIEKITGEGKSE